VRLTKNSVANATEEFFVRKRPLYEVVGQLGMWGTIINGIQASALEHKKWKESTWSGENSMLLRPSFLDFALHTGLFSWTSGGLHSWCAFRGYVDSMALNPTAAMVILYTVAPMLYRLASSAYFNLSLLSSDFYGLLFGTRPIINSLLGCA
jgi:solute carrier family 35 protein F1/2